MAEQGDRITVRWPADLVARIDDQRGDVSRSKWLRAAAEAVLANPTRAAATLAGASVNTAKPRRRPKRGVPKGDGCSFCADDRDRGFAVCTHCGTRL